MPWHLPEDLQFFKRMTMGKPIIMGGNTYRSLPGVLPGRYHIVLTSRRLAPHPQVVRAGSLSEAHSLAQQHVGNQQQAQAEIMVIGGAQVYAAWMPLARRILMTQLEQTFEGDVFFPRFNEQEWTCVTQPWRKSSSGLVYRFTDWRRCLPV